ncbi:MAG: TIGR00282 family metallophosphoesterase [Sulfuricaulis sp.]
MNLLFIGDVVGHPGRRAIACQLPALRQRLKLDLVVANAENIADGAGITRNTANELFAAGVDVLTNGNHAWDKKEALEYIVTEPRLLRPHNYPDGTPGTGWFVATLASGHKLGILNLMGNVFMHPHLACPFAAAERALAQKPDDVKMVLVDLHAEVTSEKMAMGWHLDGRVSAVVGTHTHVPTADERVLPRGTAYISDVGMTGCYDSVIGMDIEKSLKRFVQKLPERFDVAEGPATICGVLLEVNEHSGLCRSITRLRESESVAQPTVRVA